MALLAGVASRAHAELIEIEWNAEQQFSRRVDVAPNKFVEVCGKLASASKVAWKFDATSALNFNVHYHEGKDVRFPAKQDRVSQLSGELDVKLNQDYCWMWTNKGTAPAALSIDLKRSI
jgi:hypothetical protein